MIDRLEVGGVLKQSAEQLTVLSFHGVIEAGQSFRSCVETRFLDLGHISQINFSWKTYDCL